MKPLLTFALLLCSCDAPEPTESTFVRYRHAPVIIERDTTTLITDTLTAPNKECWDSVNTLNNVILILEDQIYHGGK